MKQLSMYEHLDEHLDELIFHGADNIYLIEAPELANF